MIRIVETAHTKNVSSRARISMFRAGWWRATAHRFARLYSPILRVVVGRESGVKSGPASLAAHGVEPAELSPGPEAHPSVVLPLVSARMWSCRWPRHERDLTLVALRTDGAPLS